MNFLESIRHDAAAIILMGDMFDFWYEFKLVVPKGYTRFLGKISELTDAGIEIHYFAVIMISGAAIIWKRVRRSSSS